MRSRTSSAKGSFLRRSPVERIFFGAVLVSACLGCRREESNEETTAPSSSAVVSNPERGKDAVATPPVGPPLATVTVAHGEVDTKAPPEAPLLGALALATTIYKQPHTTAKKLGYLRVGGRVPRDPEPTRGTGCRSAWYRIYPLGYVCSDEATTDLEHPILRASAVRPDLSQPLPYKYGFVRATAPQYLRIPTKKQQIDSEFELLNHLEWYGTHRSEVQSVVLGARDVALDPRGVAVPKWPHPPGYVPSTELSIPELFGARKADEGPPFWLEGNSRTIPNIADFKVPESAIFADRVRRHTGLSFVGSFESNAEDFPRRFGITVDLRLIPTSKVKPDTGSAWHGIEIPDGMHFPFAWVLRNGAFAHKLIKDRDEAKPAEEAPRRSIVLLSGNARIKAGKRYYQTLADKTRWLAADDLGIVHSPTEWPEPAEKGQKWIDISLGQQTLVLYEGKKPRYATLVSTGRDRFGDPKKDLATPLGNFRIQSKHIAAAMDSNENSTVSGGQRSRSGGLDAEAAATIDRLKAAKAAGKKLSSEDERRWANVQKGRHPEYGVTQRRGSTSFELRDVPWIQYFSAGFALHGAYWHDVFGTPRSHGCVNLAPIDARVVFGWTDPPVPEGFHGLNVGDETGEGTWVHIRK